MKLKLFDGEYAICNLENDFKDTICVDTDKFYYISNFYDKLSVVCLDKDLPNDVKSDGQWKVLEILKPINLYLVEMFSNIYRLLNDSKINIFEIAAGDKNYVLINNDDVEKAFNLLSLNGHEILI